MLVHPHDRPADPDAWRGFVDAQGFGHLVCPGSDRDLPVVVPTQYVRDGDTIRLHLARPNPALEALAENPRCLLSVAGDWAYIPGAWKVPPDGDGARGIPTTYYAAVQLSLRAAVLEGPADIAEGLQLQTAGEKLVDPSEHPRHLAAIRGLRLDITDVKAKFKFGGNLPVDARARIVAHLEKRRGPGDLAAAAHARRLLPAREVHALPPLPEDWRTALGDPDLSELDAFLAVEQAEDDVFPPMPEVFAAFAHTPFAAVRVVLLGQDPYHGPGQAHGLSFSVRPPTRPPPSLKNVFTELEADLGVPPPDHGDLTAWADRGVLLLNTVLTVRARKAGSHGKKGWEPFTDHVIRTLSDRRDGLVFLLWGKAAQDKAALVDRARHLVLESPHPSPYSAGTGFFGSRPFSAIDAWLASRGEAPIDWRP